ncbi:hypothetical protein SDC9_195346 [bioreactor metagenome]|uniref:Uncharacterized protein n=1 Tax=bioreactor metagenome TaxID=1076179 RepID=A0A645IAB3_9ZZZZ
MIELKVCIVFQHDQSPLTSNGYVFKGPAVLDVQGISTEIQGDATVGFKAADAAVCS